MASKLKPLDVIVCYHKKNNCYIKGQKATMQGIVVHSTGANNPTLRRYVDCPAEVGTNTYNNHWNTAQPDGRSVCAHAFIGYDKNNNIRVAQTLPYDMCCWLVGSGSKGSFNYNPAKIQFEMCEAALTDTAYFSKMWEVATQYCAELCIKYNWDPKGKMSNGMPVITSHKESHALGYGGNHGDPEHWFVKHNKTMDQFRQAVADKCTLLKGTDTPASEFSIGDIVMFNGGSHYSSADQASSTTNKTKGLAKVTKVAPGSKHPYHVVGEQGGAGSKNSNVYGWVDASQLAPTSATVANTVEQGDKPEKVPEPVIEAPRPAGVATIKAGSRVKIKSGAKWLGSTVAVPKWVLADTWVVHSVNGTRVILNKNVKGTNSIMSPINVAFLTLA